MQDFVSFWSALFGILSDFLLSEPVIWFVAVVLLICVAGFINTIIFPRR